MYYNLIFDYNVVPHTVVFVSLAAKGVGFLNQTKNYELYAWYLANSIIMKIILYQ